MAVAAPWTGIRDGAFYMRVPQRCCALDSVLSWVPAWIAEAQRERIYFQAPDGSLIKERRIAPRNASGAYRFSYERGPGDYRLEIPGYSFRYYALDVPSRLPIEFEPVKVHFSMEVLSGRSLYFKVPAGKAFTLGGKYHEGVTALHIEPVGGERRVTLKLQQHATYSQFDRKTITAAPKSQIWRLWVEGRGPVSFWLDDIPNLFALDPHGLFTPKLIPGKVNITVGNNVIGKAPRVGTYFEFAQPSAQLLTIVRRTRPEAATFYFLEDVLDREMNRDVSFLRAYENKLGIKDYVSILSWTQRDTISSNIHASLKFTKRYLHDHRGQRGLSIPYIALVDEPNLRYDSFAAFEQGFITMAKGLKNSSDPSIASAVIAAPESSRMVNGPPSDDADTHVGLEWAKILLKRHWDLFGAISWHEWLVRDLIATDWYFESIERVWRAMVNRAPDGAPLKKLMITQTNISGGYDLSPYEQDTFYAGLWWTSVVAQATDTGKLALLNWFTSVDYPPYKKGFISNTPDQGLALKPVGHAMAFIQPAVLNNALPVKDHSVEVDMAATTNSAGDVVSLFGVNKAKRRQQVDIALKRPYRWRGQKLNWRASYMDARLARKPLKVTRARSNHAVRLSFTLPPKTIWVIKLSKAPAPAPQGNHSPHGLTHLAYPAG